MNKAEALARYSTLEDELQDIDKNILRVKNELEALQIQRGKIVNDQRALEPILGVKDNPENIAYGV